MNDCSPSSPAQVGQGLWLLRNGQQGPWRSLRLEWVVACLGLPGHLCEGPTWLRPSSPASPCCGSPFNLSSVTPTKSSLLTSGAETMGLCNKPWAREHCGSDLLQQTLFPAGPHPQERTAPLICALCLWAFICGSSSYGLTLFQLL